MTPNDSSAQSGADNGEGPRRDAGFLARYKEFGLTSLAVDQRTAMLVLFFIISVMGIQSYRATPKESFPGMTQPILAINTMYPGVSPADVETQVTRVLEEDLSTIPELDELTSTSVEGYSSITAQFQTSVNLDEALQKVREKVDLAKPDLPADAEEPAIVEFNFSEVPIMQVNLAGEYGLVRLKDLAEQMQERFEMIPSVLRADLRGGLEREVKVDVDLGRLQYYGIEIGDVIDAIRNENVNIPGGSIDVGASKYLVRVDGELEDPALIEDFVVTVEGGRPIYVRDVATVDFGFAERESFSRMDDHAVVTLDIVKRSGENIIETADEVKAVVESMRPEFPPGTTVSITGDQSKQIVMMVSALENNIVSGLILIVGVLLFFLGLRTSIFVAISIPTSMLLSFMVLYYMGVTLNMIVLFSLILALGMLVDNSIVVVENIYRFLEQGWERRLAVKKAVGEVAVPIISSTATTLAAFIPLLFWPGEVGEFMGYLPITLIVTLSASLFVALTIVPTLCSMYIQLEGTKPEPLRPAMKWTLIGATALGLALIARSNALTAGLLVGTGLGLWALHHWVLDRLAHRFRTDTVTRIIDAYERTARWALDHRAATVGMTVAAFLAIGTVFGITHSDQIEYFPESMPPAQLLVDVETPVGTRAAVTDSLVARIEQEIMGVGGREDWESTVSVTGGAGGGGGAAMMGGGGPSGPETGRVSVSLIDFEDRQRDGFETLAEMQETIGRDIAGAEITVGQASQGPPAGAPVSIEIVGEDPEVLQTLSDQVIAILENAPVAVMLTGLESDLDAARPEVAVAVDREKAALYNLNTSDVGNAIRGAINGVEAAKYRTGNDEYDIIVRLAEPYRQELEGLRELTVMTEGTQVPLVSVASWSVQEGAGSIRRKDQRRVATITSDVAAGYANNQALAEVQTTIDEFESSLPPGYTVQYTGQSQEQAEAQEFLSGAFMIALMLIALILISQFNSVVKPVVILTSVLMSTMGVLLGLMIFQMPFGIINTGIGIISLAGVVVNNAIILIDYIGTLRSRDGMDRREALVLAGKTRFRPVILTAVTTALGLVTLAIGLNFDFFGLYRELDPDIYWGGEQAAWWGPMCVAIIAGILLATFLTLVLVPVMYSIVDDAEAFIRRHFLREEAAASAPEVAVAGG
ncbi:MAG: efflux RND transporter permease subunit [Gemmatimonadetes bacterium]|nr:efflux RND transporter permease subunit [Gemmatimonadota bacterium]